MATGIRDRVAILGMGCSKFGERWNDNAEDLMHEAFGEALADAGIERDEIEAAWLSTAIEEQHAGKSGLPLAIALRRGGRSGRRDSGPEMAPFALRRATSVRWRGRPRISPPGLSRREPAGPSAPASGGRSRRAGRSTLLRAT